MELPAVVDVALDLERAGLRAYLLLMIAHMARTGAPRPPPPPPPPLTRVPVVTVQLPLRDEDGVVDRLLGAVARLDWPRERLEIQVLDDSTTEERSASLRSRVATLAAGGLPVVWLRRVTGGHGKAGNLQHGLECCRGELITILDADAVPAPDLLQRLVPELMADERIGLVQGRQTWLNRDHSCITRVQATLVDTVMVIDQPARSDLGRALHFNGSAGVWRRACIEQCGGWRGLAEDLDLSVRAQVLGWRILHRAAVEVPSELAWTLADFRRQQVRWIEGKVQVLRDTGPWLLSRVQGWPRRIDLLSAVWGRLLHPLLLVLTLLYPLGLVGLVGPSVFPLVGDAALFVALVAATAAWLRPVSAGPLWQMVPLSMGVMMGLSVVGTQAWARGLLLHDQPFLPTPKGGTAGAGDRSAVIETGIGLAYVALLPTAWSAQGVAGLGFTLFVAASYLGMGLGGRWWSGPAVRRG